MFQLQPHLASDWRYHFWWKVIPRLGFRRCCPHKSWPVLMFLSLPTELESPSFLVYPKHCSWTCPCLCRLDSHTTNILTWAKCVFNSELHPYPSKTFCSHCLCGVILSLFPYPSAAPLKFSSFVSPPVREGVLWLLPFCPQRSAHLLDDCCCLGTVRGGARWPCWLFFL